MEVTQDEGARPVKNWAKGIEAAALQQAKNIARLPFIARQGIALMPDAHSGKGSTIGSVIATERAIIPAAVGVDIGCVDAETEYLSPTGWRRMDEYDGGQVMQYWQSTGVASFVQPDQFIRRPADVFYKLKSKYGIDQMLSPEHRVLYRATSRVKGAGEMTTILAEQLFDIHDKNIQGFSGRFLTTFAPQLRSALSLNDASLRVMVMVCADGAFDLRPGAEGKRCVLQFTKDRKLQRAETLLTAAGIEFRRDDLADERGCVYRLIFEAPLREKSLGAFWSADAMQLEAIAMEAMKWDGWDNRVFYTRDKASADFMQYALSGCGYRAVMRADNKGDDIDYRVFANTNTEVGIKSVPKTPIEKIDATGQEKFCFVVPSSFWIMRRGGNVVVTGNCGMNAVRLTLKAHQLPDNLAGIRDAIEKAVPLGKGGHLVTDRTLFKPAPGGVIRAFGENDDWIAKAVSQLGTLGSGNHFIELCLDENQDVWIMLHSGSRGIGNKIGTHYIERAKRRMEQFFISLPDGDLAYLPEDTDDFNEYMEAVGWAQNYALENRRLMMERVICALRRHIPLDFTITQEAINCHHNYVERENHFGRNMWVTRKGAIRAREGDLGIIPGSMGQRSYIVRGKGNTDSYCSCSHGAGRVMSRAQARRTFTLTDLVAQTQGVECRKDDAVLDEIPGAYKNIDEVMANQADLVEVLHTLKQVMCVKGA